MDGNFTWVRPAPRLSTRAGFVLAAGLLAAAAASYPTLDRPIATWVHGALAKPGWAARLADIGDAPVFLALLGVVAAGVWFAVARRLTPGLRTVVALIAAVLFAFAAIRGLKFCFGRTWPETWTDGNPSWIRDHVFGFNPFHGGKGWESFPSGHTARTAAPCAVVWGRSFQWRGVAVGVPILVAVGLLGANFHFLSDCLAGAAVGVLCGVAALRLLRI